MIEKIVDHINESFESLKNLFKDGRIYGLAQAAKREANNEIRVSPVVTKLDGEGFDVSIDSTKSFIIYHKLRSVSFATTGQGYGDAGGDFRNSYQMELILYVARDRAKMFGDDVFLKIQHLWPVKIVLHPFRSIKVSISSVTTDTLSVFNTEYQNVNDRLRPNDDLFRINYTVEVQFRQDCFKIC